MLTELQEVLADLKEAREKIEELSAAKAGDEVYDYIMAVCLNESDPIGTCKAQVDELVRLPTLASWASPRADLCVVRVSAFVDPPVARRVRSSQRSRERAL